jgi:hypothetical protein
MFAMPSSQVRFALQTAQQKNSNHPPQAFCTKKVTKCPTAILLLRAHTLAPASNPVSFGIYCNVGKRVSYLTVRQLLGNLPLTGRFRASGLYLARTVFAVLKILYFHQQTVSFS